jgi:hypothetical protein
VSANLRDVRLPEPPRLIRLEGLVGQQQAPRLGQVTNAAWRPRVNGGTVA